MPHFTLSEFDKGPVVGKVINETVSMLVSCTETNPHGLKTRFKVKTSEGDLLLKLCFELFFPLRLCTSLQLNVLPGCGLLPPKMKPYPSLTYGPLAYTHSQTPHPPLQQITAAPHSWWILAKLPLNFKIQVKSSKAMNIYELETQGT